MTRMNPLPPQAYTKDVFLQAYSWVQNQAPSIKEIATTPDILVSLYLKATRDGDSALERPSIQNFKNELKNLAGMMGELDKPPTSSMAPQTVQAPSSSATISIPSMPFASFVASPPTPTQPETSQPQPISAPTSLSQPVKTEFDPLTLQMLKETRELFNLSSDNEALRMLIKVGYTKAKDLIK